MMSRALPNPEMAVREILRDDTALMSILSNDQRRIDVEDRSLEHKQSSYVIVYRAGGSPDRFINFDQSILTIQCYAEKGKRGAALRLTRAVQSALLSVHNVDIDDTHVSLIRITNVQWAPDSSDGSARYILSITADTKALTNP